MPYGEETAINGQWVKGPGATLFKAVKKALGNDLPIFAEDLGIITKEVEQLRDSLGFPGMKVLQFGFENLEENGFLPHHFTRNCICYTGTHDNDTTRGWFEQANEKIRDKVRRYFNCDGSIVTWGFRPVAQLLPQPNMPSSPLQDLFGLDSTARMNTPGKAAGNWAWRYTSDMLSDGFAGQLKETASFSEEQEESL